MFLSMMELSNGINQYTIFPTRYIKDLLKHIYDYTIWRNAIWHNVTFKGRYDSPDPETVKLKQGHNKDFRPDCKQIVFGLNITADGHVPLSYKLFDGNTPDDITHIPNWNGLRILLKKEDFIYVADCKLCSQKNLMHLSKNGGYFITIVPKGRNEIKQFKKYLRQNEIQWKNAFDVENSRKKGVLNNYNL